MEHFEVSCHIVLLLNSKRSIWAKWRAFYKLSENSFSSLPAENLLHYNMILMELIFFLRNSEYFVEAKANFHNVANRFKSTK